MRPNRHPADELADIRGRIRALKAREAELRGVLLGDAGQRTGAENRVIVRRHRRRVFQKDKLPPEVLRDPAFWEETETTRVVVESRDATGAPQRRDRAVDWAGPGEVDAVLFRRVTGRWPDG